MILLFCFFAFSSSRIFIFISSYFCLPCLAHTHDDGHLLYHSTLHVLPSKVCSSVSMLQLPEFRWTWSHSMMFLRILFLSIFLSFFPSFLLSFFYNLTETIVMQILHFVKRYSAFCPDSACILLFCYVVYCSTKLDAISLLDCICLLSYPLQLY